MARYELLQFARSHYNEKARWALDWKRVPHRRTSLLPGPHALAVRRLTGQTQVPVLKIDDEVVVGSARIIDELERRFPEPPLYPADPALRERALGIQARFDAEVGGKVRRALFSLVLDDSAYVVRMFAEQKSGPVRALYQATFPLLVRPVMRSTMNIRGKAVDEAFAATLQAFDFVAKHAGPEGCLVGDRFSVADLAAAALLAPAANPPDSPMTRPEPPPEPLARWAAEIESHPGVAWVRETYRKHRPPSSELAGE